MKNFEDLDNVLINIDYKNNLKNIEEINSMKISFLDLNKNFYM